MNFTINSTALAKHLAIVSKAQANKNALPILDCILVEQKDGKVRLTASDTENYLTCELEASEYDGEMKIALNSRQFLSSIKEISDQPIIIETTDGKNVSIKYLNGKYNLMSDEAEMYPQNTLRSTQAKGFDIDSECLSDGLSRCSFAVANDELRPQMNGVYLDTTKDGFVFVASDGHKLAMDKFDNPEQITDASFIIQPKTTNMLLSMIGKDSTTVSITVAENKSTATFRINEYILSSRLIDKSYPKYNSVIPKDLPYSAIIDKESLNAAVRRVMICASGISGLVRFHFDGNTLSISAQDIDFSKSAEEHINVDADLSPVSIGFGGALVTQVLAKIPGDSITMHFVDPSRAATFVPTTPSDSGEDILMLLMPMMLQD